MATEPDSGTRPTDLVPEEERAWWKEGFVYQIYPRSFNDSNGDGIGDIRGIIQKLDYLDDLGVDVVWLNPVYDSPQVDGGYDIRDYRAIHDEYGCMDDWEELLEGMHDRDMRLIMDLVVNHTSDEHEWFAKSKRGEDGYDDYYWWRSTGGGLPNNWTSSFGGPAWTYDVDRGQYYLHLFHSKQPDLNWENPEVRGDVYDMVDWWLSKGIDGFRMDVINLISKNPELPDGHPGGWTGMEHHTNGPRVHDYLDELHDETYGNYDAMTVGECIDADPERAKRFCHPDNGGMSMVFHYEHMMLDFRSDGGWWEVGDWSVGDLRDVISRWQRELEDSEAWNTIFLGTHDWPRIVSRWGDAQHYRRESAKLLATFLFTLQGTPYLLQGDEIGMTNFPFERIDQIRDAETRGRIRFILDDARSRSLTELERVALEDEGFEQVKDIVRYRCRDNARTPVQWSDDAQAGFTDGEPWLAVNPNHTEINVEAAREDPDSVWHHYRDLIDLRSDSDLLVYGEYGLLVPHHDRVWAYERTLGEQRAVVVLNWSSESATVGGLDLGPEPSLVLDTHDRTNGDGHAEPLELDPWEARVYRTQ